MDHCSPVPFAQSSRWVIGASTFFHTWRNWWITACMLVPFAQSGRRVIGASTFFGTQCDWWITSYMPVPFTQSNGQIIGASPFLPTWWKWWITAYTLVPFTQIDRWISAVSSIFGPGSAQGVVASLSIHFTWCNGRIIGASVHQCCIIYLWSWKHLRGHCFLVHPFHLHPHYLVLDAMDRSLFRCRSPLLAWKDGSFLDWHSFMLDATDGSLLICWSLLLRLTDGSLLHCLSLVLDASDGSLLIRLPSSFYFCPLWASDAKVGDDAGKHE